jgi:hypothetical protein
MHAPVFPHACQHRFGGLFSVAVFRMRGDGQRVNQCLWVGAADFTQQLMEQPLNVGAGGVDAGDQLWNDVQPRVDGQPIEPFREQGEERRKR